MVNIFNQVAKGKMNAYVVLNPTSTIKSALQGLNGNTNDVVVALNAARIATIASATGNNAFVMYGSTPNQTLQEKQTTPVSVTVDRIVAKMKEETNSDKISNDVTMSARINRYRRRYIKRLCIYKSNR